MQMCLDISEETMMAIRLLADKPDQIIRMAAAVKLFEMNKLSSGAAAELAGIPRTVFLSHLADYGVASFNLSEDDLKQETRFCPR